MHYAVFGSLIDARSLCTVELSLLQGRHYYVYVLSRYPDVLRNKWTACLKTLNSISSEKTTLEKNKKRPKPLRLFEPAIEEKYVNCDRMGWGGYVYSASGFQLGLFTWL